MTTPEALTLIVHAPALVEEDARALDVIHGMEKALPGLRLAWRVSEGGHPIALPNRDAWLAKMTRDGKFPLLCNGDESYPVTVFGMGVSGRLSPGGQARLEVHAETPSDAPVIAAAAAMLEAVAEGARAYWGHASPYGYGSEVAQQFRRSPHGPERSPRGLPMLIRPEKLSAPATPWFLAWLNYWSAAAAQVIGFPDPARDAELLTRARRTPSGGWIVQLTDAPLDYDNPAHLDALLRAYERFPEIGGRAAP
ncbi:hypothetical protein JYK02_13735 [Corallococcus macrosporus]|uniref:Immunity protein 52 domain-containing protein n=1 Tax=Corallococcus macrosporus TaxID=35 RepID=A0ABS3DAA4_9BACT|nr:DUF5953 family protein [Corallococcus macrosporus]MBN8228568.1 hypothetical protein [Corallococcus macrosporus]